MKRTLKYFSLTLILFFTNTYAINNTNNNWDIDVAPYMWAINMNGTVGVGDVRAHLDESFSDLLKQLNFAAMLFVTAHKNNFGLYFNGINALTTNNVETNIATITEKNNFGIYGAGISYIVLQKAFAQDRSLELEPYLGARYTVNDTRISVADFSFKKNESWTDPVVGLRFNYHFNKNWNMLLIGDIGGVNTTTQYSYSAAALLGYQLNNVRLCQLTAYLGYRQMDQRYQTGSGNDFYNWNVKLFGPILGLNIRL